MKRSVRTWSLSLLLMIGGSSLLWNTARRSVSKKGRILFVNAFSGASPPADAGKRNRERPLSPEPATTTSDASNDSSIKRKENSIDDYDDNEPPPWNNPDLAEQAKKKKSVRARQHVNPLARKFQQPTVLSVNWPQDVFQNLSKPLFLDIGCSRGGFLIDIASERPDDYNYLGLEIRPIVVYHAKERIAKHNLQGRLDFVGCNANIDLERLLTSLTIDKNTENDDNSISSSSYNLQMVTIQFPDPHFKARHSKRRVVTPELVQVLARFMPTGATIFLQSDIQSVLDEMRLQFREHPEYFQDTYESLHEYEAENILGIPTERETSVLERNLPVYRAIFVRT